LISFFGNENLLTSLASVPWGKQNKPTRLGIFYLFPHYDTEVWRHHVATLKYFLKTLCRRETPLS
jgi:hypothetical protein